MCTQVLVLDQIQDFKFNKMDKCSECSDHTTWLWCFGLVEFFLMVFLVSCCFNIAGYFLCQFLFTNACQQILTVTVVDKPVDEGESTKKLLLYRWDETLYSRGCRCFFPGPIYCTHFSRKIFNFHDFLRRIFRKPSRDCCWWVWNLVPLSLRGSVELNSMMFCDVLCIAQPQWITEIPTKNMIV